MCGIAGIISLKNNSLISKKLMKHMTDMLVHRGPDDSGLYVDSNVALGHRRLSIIDLSINGRQPMFDSGNKTGIVFNGEIYNYKEIKLKLLEKGYKFKSDTDTEVILNAYNHTGIDCLKEFNGMFGLCLYDKVKRKIFLCRDRLGIKPLYYTESDGKLIFASEIKSILEYPGINREPDLEGVSSYLSYRYPLEDRTFFKGIKSLKPGHYLEIAGDSYNIKEYWDIPAIIDKEDFGEEYYIKRIRELLESSVKYRMISDVPLGGYLSGGLDSSILVSLMSNFSNKRVKTFTIGFEEKGFNEFNYSRIVSEQYNTDHKEIPLSMDNYFENMNTLIGYKDGPLGVANEPALYVMSKELKKDITVVLSGEGADELFGGYGRIFRSPFDYMRFNESYRNEKIKDKDIIKVLLKNLNEKYGDKKFSNETDHFLHLYQYINWEDKKELLSGEFTSKLGKDKNVNSIFYNYFDKLKGMNLYDKYLWIFEKLHLVGLLHRTDVTTMATSVEARVPFVDHRLVEFAQSIPIKYKLKWKSALDKKSALPLTGDRISEKFDIPKYILKKSYENHLPEEIVYRKKIGFPVPVHKWLGNDFNENIKEILLCKKAKERGIYNSNQLENYLTNKGNFTEHSNGLKIWMLVNLELWFNKYF